MELEDEEPPVPPFWEDERVQFMGNWLQNNLKIKADKWIKFVEDELNEKILKEFLDFGDKLMLIFSVASSGNITVTEEINTNLKVKAVYAKKKTPTIIGLENYKKELHFGELSSTSLNQSLALIEEVVVPFLSNKKNHRSWPCFVSDDMNLHLEFMKNKIHIVKGLLEGKTILPIPTMAMTEPNETRSSKDAPFTRGALHAFESMIIKWSYQLRDVIEKDSSQPLLQGLNPGPETELDFWKGRRENLTSIYKQIRSPAVRRMATILEESESSYFPTFQNIVREVNHALCEAEDVDMHLKPLRQQIKTIVETDFPQIYVLMPTLLHTVCLIWTHSKFYNIPARIIVLLQEFCNLFIEKAKSYLSPEDIFKEEFEEALEHIQVTINVLRSFKEAFLGHRSKLGTFYKDGREFKPWDFRFHMVFARYDRFLERLMKIEDIFLTMLEFQKLEKLEFGGNMGKMLNEHVSHLYNEFMDSCKVFQDSTVDTTDCSNKDFENEYEVFKEKMLDFDTQLASLLCAAFNDCSGLESAFKVICQRKMLKRESTPAKYCM